jgi:mono/diheme cytochrome c family protein
MSHSEDPALQRSLHRWKIAGAVTFLGLVLFFPLSRAVEASDRASGAVEMGRSTVTLGQKVYASNCAKCHGDEGQGVDSPALNSKQFLDVATEEQIYLLASGGIPGTLMPTWSEDLGGPLTDEQLRAVATYIMTWAPGAPDVPDWRTKFLGTPPPMSTFMTPTPTPTATPSPDGQGMAGMPGMSGSGGMSDMPGMGGNG